MSNILHIPAVSLHLNPEHFDYTKLSVCQDRDGNGIAVTEDGMSFFPAEVTTWRELRNFIAKAIAPAAKDLGEGTQIRTDIEDVREESNNFKEPFTLCLCLSLLPASAWRDYVS